MKPKTIEHRRSDHRGGQRLDQHYSKDGNLSEKDRRQYAGIEACKRGYSGISYIARLFVVLVILHYKRLNSFKK